MNMTNGIVFNRSRWVLVAALLGLWVAGTGCDENKDFDHEPAAGKGALIINNITPNDINVYADGAYLGQVGDNDDRAFDLEPGIHRVVLDEEDGDRYASDDTDVLEGRLTVLTVTSGGFSSDDYDVSTDFQD